ncbi:MAG: glycosyltransferase family 39 protein, partial [Anaerolineae bacterium]|nr:glycosyltransferase family 39 protein [Anaerolineae bacterium]
MMKYRQIGILGGLVVILLIAFLLRVHDIGGQSLWHDEGNTYVQTTRNFAEIADNAGRDIHPPLYYWLITVWTRFMGDSETGLRSLSLFASLITVAVTFAIGKRLFGIIPAVFAMIFISLNTFSIYYAQEARMYALLALLGALAMWLFVRFIMPVRTAFLPSTRLDAQKRVRIETIASNPPPQNGEKINSPHEKSPLSI